MSFHAQFDRLTAFLMNLECLDSAGQMDAIINEVLETDGWFGPNPDISTDEQPFYTVLLHEASGHGWTEEDAAQAWRREASYFVRMNRPARETADTSTGSC